jgi:large repetitive protein
MPARGCYNSLPVNVNFQIEDIAHNIMGTQSSGNIFPDKDTIHWNRRSFSFNTGVNTSVVLVLKNNGIGGCGNDLAIDDISFAPCGPLLSFLPVTGKCSGESFTLTLNGAIPTYPSPRYQWQKSTDNGVTWANIGTSTGSNTLTTSETTATGVTKTVLFRALVAPEELLLNNVNCRVISPVISIPINPLPVPAFTAQPVYCENKPITFTSSNTNVNFSWTFEQGNPATSTAANPTVSWASMGTYSVNLEVTDKTTGCKSIPNSGSQSISINSNPDITITSSGLNFCTGSSVTLTANSSNASSYQWSSNGNNISTNITIIVNTSGSYNVVATNSKGCTNSAAINVNAYPAVIASVAYTNANCYGDSSAAAFISTSSGIAPFQYVWKNTAGIIPNQSASSLTKLSAGNYSVTITDFNGCTVEKSFVITQPTQITASATVTSSTCGIANGSATASASGGSGPYS